MKNIDIDYFIAKWVLNFRFDPDEIPAFALGLLENGHETPQLIELSVTTKDEIKNIDPKVKLQSIFKDVGVPIPSKNDAAIIVSKRISREILSGEINPVDGANLIWDDICVLLEEIPEELEEFCACASNYEDISSSAATEFYGLDKQREKLESIKQDIVAHAQKVSNF